MYPDANQAAEIKKIALVLEKIRTIFGGRSIHISSWLRPAAYNELIGGAKKSMHLRGAAVDFRIEGLTCNWVRATLIDHLQDLGIRMECLDDANWVHIDNKEVVSGRSRYFMP